MNKTDKKNDLTVNYSQGDKKWWTGRSSNQNFDIQYWHEVINVQNINDLKNLNDLNTAFLGYACDEGVRRNLGRPGAVKGPEMIRERLSKLPVHFTNKHIVDFGNFECVKNDMESCQNALRLAIRDLISNNVFPIVFGGGHDLAYGHFFGIYDALKHTSKRKIGVINFDAHFDLRELETKPNSGTPFNQIITELNEEGEDVDYFAIGIQQQSNTKSLFQTAKEKNVMFSTNYECESTTQEISLLKHKLRPFIEKNDYLYITIDMDGFSSAYAPGVSSPSPLGFTPFFVFKLLLFLFDSKKVISCDIAELNPKFDRDNLTANLAAKIVDFIVTNNSLQN